MESFKRISTPTPNLSLELKEKVQRSWSPPPTGWCKINVDVAINFKEHSVGLGVVITDANRKTIAAAVKISKLHSDVTFAEAEVVKWSLDVANRVGLSAIILELDSQNVIDLVNNRKSSRTEIYWITSEVQNKIQEFKNAGV